MERAAFSWMSKKKLPTVSTTIFKLDSGDVINAKDRAAVAREMSRKRESRASMGAQGEASTNQVATQTADMSNKDSVFKQEESQAPIYRESAVGEDSSQSAKIARNASTSDAHEAATEHAIPGPGQIQSEGISDPAKGIKEADNNQTEELTGTIAVPDNDLSYNLPATANIHVPVPQSSLKPKRKSSPGVVRTAIPKPKVSGRKSKHSQPPGQASLEQPRLRRSARKTSTSHPASEVDWSEDIRPTDDDEPLKNKRAASKGTFVSSPDAKSATPDKSSRKKRKAPKTKQDSAKRQKATKKRDSTRAQLPITADRGDKCQPETVKANPQSASNLLDAQLDNACTWDAIDMPAASFPILDDADKGSKTLSQRHEIIELSSDSPLSNLSSPTQGTNSPGSNEQTTKANLHGRGVTVGQKLANALRKAGSNSRDSPTVDSRFSYTQKPALGTTSEVPKSHSLLPNHVLQNQNPFISELEMGLDEPTDTSTAGEQMGPHKSDLISNTHIQQTTSVSLTTLVLPAPGPSDTQNLVLHTTRLLERKGNGDGADNPMEISDNSSQATHSSEQLENSKPLPHIGQDYPEAGVQHLEDLETSSQSTYSPMPDGITMLSVQGSESEHTPESQKPLLSVHTRPQQIAPLAFPKSITRSSIVDRNGSPRLCPQTEMESGRLCPDIDRFCLQSIRIADSSSSEDSEDYDGYHYKRKYRSGRAWSKFQRDMFMEYGIGPEKLATGMTRRTALGDSVKIDSRVGQISAPATENDTEPPGEDKHGDCSMVEGGIAHNDTAPAIVPNSTSSSIDDFSVEAGHDASLSRQQEKRMSTESTSLGLPGLLKQGNLDNMDWISELQAAQQSAHSLLMETNQHLSSQLAAEQDTIRQVLHIYRQGCNRILDDLFRAQEVRMQLYRQQMSSVKEQHTQICRELIQGLQELDHRVQQGP